MNLILASLGMFTPLGRNALQTSMMLRAGQHASAPLHSRMGHARRRSCRIRGLPDDCMGAARLLALACPALLEATRSEPNESRPLLLALPAHASDKVNWPAELARRTGVTLVVDQSERFEGGRLAGLRALDRAAALLQSGDADSVLVGAVDSHHHPERLRSYWSRAETGRPTPHHNGQLPPGEAAVFMVLRRSTRSTTSRATAPRSAVARLTRPTWALLDEPEQTMLAQNDAVRQQIRARPAYKRLCSEEAPRDEALHKLLKELLTPLSTATAQWIVSDDDQQPITVERWTATSREFVDTSWPHTRPLIQLGDAGTATLPLLAALTAVSFRLHSAPADHAWVVSTAEPTARAALAVRPAQTTNARGR